MVEKKHFDLMATNYDRLARQGFWGMLKRQEISVLMGRVRLCPRAEAILDLGCGPGIYARRIKQEFPQCSLVGVDRSYLMIEEFQKQGFQGYCGDLSTVDLGARQFDIILLLGVLEFIKAPEEAFSVLNKNSHPETEIFVLVPRFSFLNGLYLLYHRLHGNRVFIRTRTFYIQLFQSAGFALQEESVPTMVSRLLRFRPALAGEGP